MTTPVYQIESTYLRLRPDASTEALPLDGGFWQRLMRGELGDFRNEYLVTSFSFEEDWPSWERHPKGDEMVCLLAGSVTLVLAREQGEERVALREPGSYVVVPRGCWHTAETRGPARMLFITAGEGTEIREKQGEAGNDRPEDLDSSPGRSKDE